MLAALLCGAEPSLTFPPPGAKRRSPQQCSCQMLGVIPLGLGTFALPPPATKRRPVAPIALALTSVLGRQTLVLGRGLNHSLLLVRHVNLPEILQTAVGTRTHEGRPSPAKHILLTEADMWVVHAPALGVVVRCVDQGGNRISLLKKTKVSDTGEQRNASAWFLP